MIRRARTQNKQLRIRLQTQRTTSGEAEVIGEAVILLPAHFTNFNAALPWLLRIDTEIGKPAEWPDRDPGLPDPLPTNHDGEPLPFYPWNFTLTGDGMLRQTDYYALPISGVISFAEFE